MIKNIAILGAGSFGKALNAVLSSKGLQVTMWGRNAELNDISQALNNADNVIIAVPMIALREVLRLSKSYLPKNACIISATKGVEYPLLKFSSDIVREELGEEYYRQSLYLSGPSFAQELAQGLPTAVSLACVDAAIGVKIQETLSTHTFRVYLSSDILGVEIGGALKNVIAIAAGLAQGLQLGENAQASLITRGLAEMMRLASKMGAESDTLFGLSGLGDLVLTCKGNLSRNRRVGIGLAQGKSLEDILVELGEVAEGINTARSIPELCMRYDIEMPICMMVNDVLSGTISPENAVHSLMTRKLKWEVD